MNDFMYEQLVARKSKATDYLIRALVIVLILVLAILGPGFLGFFAILLALALLLAAIFFIFPRLKVEYEYILLNHEMQVDVIYNKSRRKTLLEFDILKAEAIVSKNADSIRSHRIEKIYDFSSGQGSDDVYAIIVPVERQNACIYIEPDETMKTYMNNWTGPHMQLR